MPTAKLFNAESQQKTLVVVPLGNVSSLAGENVKSELDELLEQLRQGEINSAVVDLEKVSYFGTSMLEVMHALWRHARARGGKLVLCNVSDMGKEILRVSRFDTLWPICSTRQEALTAAEAPAPPSPSS